MKTPKAEKVNLPYASTVASFYGDQGQVTGNSFLSKVFAAGKKPAEATSASPGAGIMK